MGTCAALGFNAEVAAMSNNDLPRSMTERTKIRWMRRYKGHKYSPKGISEAESKRLR